MFAHFCLKNLVCSRGDRYSQSRLPRAEATRLSPSETLKEYFGITFYVGSHFLGSAWHIRNTFSRNHFMIIFYTCRLFDGAFYATVTPCNPMAPCRSKDNITFLAAGSNYQYLGFVLAGLSTQRFGARALVLRHTKAMI